MTQDIEVDKGAGGQRVCLGVALDGDASFVCGKLGRSARSLSRTPVSGAHS
jgi:hypothetical protein